MKRNKIFQNIWLFILLLPNIVYSQHLSPIAEKINHAKNEQKSFYEINNLLEIKKSVNNNFSLKVKNAKYFNFNKTSYGQLVSSSQEYITLTVPLDNIWKINGFGFGKNS